MTTETRKGGFLGLATQADIGSQYDQAFKGVNNRVTYGRKKTGRHYA